MEHLNYYRHLGGGFINWRLNAADPDALLIFDHKAKSSWVEYSDDSVIEINYFVTLNMLPEMVSRGWWILFEREPHEFLFKGAL